MSVDEFEMLQDRARQNLIHFLSTEIDLGFTLAQTAKIEARSGERANFERARKFAESAIETVDRFKGRIVSPEALREIEDRAAELKKVISALEVETSA